MPLKFEKICAVSANEAKAEAEPTDQMAYNTIVYHIT